MNDFKKVVVLKTKITIIDYDKLINKILKTKKKKLIVAPIASHPIVQAYFDKEYQNILNQIDFLVPDSQYVRISLKLLYGVYLKDRIYGPELMNKLLKKGQEKKLKIFFIGNNSSLFIKSLKKYFPKLKKFYFYDLNYQKISKKTLDEINQKLNNIDIIFIGIGSPNQHILALKIKKEKPIVCVGAAFDFLSGAKKQAPKWLGDFGLEWLFRLIQEPKRLWKRYLVDGIIFVFLVLKQKLLKNNV